MTRRTAIGLLIASVLLAVARLCTGIVYRSDEAVVALVMRPPALQSERFETDPLALRREIVIDEDEVNLVYREAYLGLMEAVPILSPLMAIAGLFLLRRHRRPA